MQEEFELPDEILAVINKYVALAGTGQFFEDDVAGLLNDFLEATGNETRINITISYPDGSTRTTSGIDDERGVDAWKERMEKYTKGDVPLEDLMINPENFDFPVLPEDVTDELTEEPVEDIEDKELEAALEDIYLEDTLFQATELIVKLADEKDMDPKLQRKAVKFLGEVNYKALKDRHRR